MKVSWALAAATALAIAACAQDSTGIAIEIPSAPSPVRAGSGTWLLYELHITNLSRRAVELVRVEISAGGETTVMDAPRLDSGWMRRPGGDESAPRRIGPGLRAMVLVNATVGAVTPSAVVATAHFRAGDRGEFRVSRHVPVSKQAPLVLGPPLRDGNWVVMNGLGAATHHRRSFLAADGRVVIPQRFAIDWVKVDETGSARKSGEGNTAYHGYGAEVLAVANATVAEVRDGMPDIAPFSAAKNPVSMDRSTGNHVILDLGRGAFALYAHLQPGSLRVKKGQRVKTGDPIGKLGSSGMSDLPHLHFQVTDRAEAMRTDGLPFVLDRLEIVGKVESIEALLEGKGFVPRMDRRTRELPLDLEVVRFP